MLHWQTDGQLMLNWRLSFRETRCTDRHKSKHMCISRRPIQHPADSFCRFCIQRKPHGSDTRTIEEHQTTKLQGSKDQIGIDAVTKSSRACIQNIRKKGTGTIVQVQDEETSRNRRKRKINLASWNGKEGRRIHGRGTQHAFDSDPPWIELMDPSFLPHGTRDTGVVPSSSRPAEALSSRSRRGRRDLDSFSTESRPLVEMISIEGRGPRGLGCGIIEFLFHLVSIDESILFAFQLEEAHTYVRFVFASLSCFFEGSRGKDGRPSHVRGRWFRCEGMDRSLPLGRS